MKRLVFIAIGCLLLVIGAGTIIYQTAIFFMMPVYEATAFISVGKDFDRELFYHRPSFVFSTNVLYDAIDSLDLRSVWGKNFFGEGGQLQHKSAYAMLVGRIGIYYNRNRGSPLEIILYSDSATEAIELANAIGYSSQDWLNRSPNFKSNATVTKAVKAKRLILSPIWTSRRPIIWGISCLSFGIILIWFGRKLPKVVLIQPTSPPDSFSKY